MQEELKYGPALQRVGEMKEIPEDLVAMCRNWRDAIKLCISQNRKGLGQEAFAKACGTSWGNFNRIINRPGKQERYPDPAWFQPIQRLAGNKAIKQFFEMELEGELNHQRSAATKEEEIAELRAKLAELEGRAA